MKTAILSCNIGSIDQIWEPVKIKTKHHFEYFYWTENNLPFPLPNIDNRMKGKYLKTLSHKLVDHDIHVWIDGSIEIKDGTFIDWIHNGNGLTDSDVLMTTHAERSNPYDELEFIKDQMKAGHPYLISRYAKQPFDAELEFYRKEGLPDVPLFNCFFFARRNSEKVNKAFEDWWDLTLRYSNLDQAMFSYVVWKHNLKIKIVDAKDYIIRHRHNDSC